MKKLATLLLAAGLVFGAATGASAIDFKASGEWMMSFELGANGDFNAAQGGFNHPNDGKEDNFEAEQRIRLKMDAVASENLSGTVMFEIGESRWGQDTSNHVGRGSGNALGADGVSIEVKRAYLDWIVPNTDLSLRMGLQGVALPSFVNGSQVLDDDVAAIVANYKFNDNVALTALWARPFNDNYETTNTDKYTFDNVDVFAAIVPLTYDGVSVTPWVAYGMVGKNDATLGAFRNSTAADRQYMNRKADTYGTMFAAGLTGEITMADPFRFAWDLEYSGYKSGFGGKKHLTENSSAMSSDQAGWVFAALGEYKMDWGTPGLYAWYASGNDDNAYNGSEQIFQLNNGGSEFAALAFDGNNGTNGIGRGYLLGDNVAGTWGIGARLKDMSFLEGLKHTFRVTYMMGTNSNDSVTYGGTKSWKSTALSNADSHKIQYNLGTTESALEVSLSNTYQIYENLTMYAEVAYLKLFLDDDLRWDSGDKGMVNGQRFEQGDAFNVNVAFQYSF
ncbi:MAG: outer membrane homotrimeric porin [Desulfovibrionaceae bacterium]|nr:outer membrane homotrimeric porin [Desulfovibrionaceae bacterium]